jgi:hypothetical protein
MPFYREVRRNPNENSALFEIARVLVRLGDVAGSIVNANHSIMYDKLIDPWPNT